MTKKMLLWKLVYHFPQNEKTYIQIKTILAWKNLVYASQPWQKFYNCDYTQGLFVPVDGNINGRLGYH